MMSLIVGERGPELPDAMAAAYADLSPRQKTSRGGAPAFPVLLGSLLALALIHRLWAATSPAETSRLPDRQYPKGPRRDF